MQNFSEQVQDVYGALGEAADSAGEEELDQVVSMSRPSAPMMKSSNMMMSSSAMPRGGSMMMQDESRMMRGSAAEPSKKRKKATTQIAGSKRLNDEVSTKLYKLSKM